MDTRVVSGDMSEIPSVLDTNLFLPAVVSDVLPISASFRFRDHQESDNGRGAFL